MASSRERTLVALVFGLALALSGCGDGGRGEGTVTGSVVVPECDLDEPTYDLDPSFFGADPMNDFLAITLQHSSGPADLDDGVLIAVQSASQVQMSHLGEALPISLDPSALVRMSILLGRSCPADRTRAAAAMSATSGTITFAAIYAPEISTSDRLIEATFSAHFEAPGDPSTHADLSGSFSFLFSRGRPVQVFP